MANIYLISDTHFGHANALKFLRADGVTPMRSFSCVEEMDQRMIDNWNRVVKPSDHVYHLGDVALKRQDVDRVMPQLHGHLRLVRGNHDIFKTALYARYFDEIYGVRVLDDIIFSHIPVHPLSIKERWHGNCHGHLHEKDEYPGRYLNVAVERINYTPIALEDVKKLLGARKLA